MSFLGTLGHTAVGAAGGFAMGGPLGAVAGGLSGGLSAGSGPTSSTGANMNKDTATTNHSETGQNTLSGSKGGTHNEQGGTSSGLGTSYTEMRDWTAEELAAYNQSMSGASQSLNGLSPAEQETLRQRTYQANYQPAATAINEAYQDQSASGYANASRSGNAKNSRTKEEEAALVGSRARNLGLASNQATSMAEQAVMAEQANRRAASAAYMNNLNQLWQQRLMGSKQIQTSSGRNDSTGDMTTNQNGYSNTNSITDSNGTSNVNSTSSGTATAPNTFLGDAVSGLGESITDPNSWLNQNLLHPPG